jgi:drug/metabolite transporter (DMT)-like permease
MTMHSLGVFLLILSAWCLSMTIVLTRKLKEIHYSVILFWYSFTGMVSFGSLRVCGAVQDYSLLDLDRSVWKLMFMIGVLSMFNQYFQVLSQQNGKSLIVAILGLCQPVYALVSDIFLFDEQFTITQIKGGLIIEFLKIIIIYM